MALDEALLEHVQMGASATTLRLFAWLPPCLSLGQAQPIADVDMDRLHAHGWDVVRRLTGGRAILHTDELTYSIIAPTSEPNVAGSVLDSYNRLALALVAGVSMLGLPVEIQSNGRGEPSMPTSFEVAQGGLSMLAGNGHNPVCFEMPSTHEITVAGKKLIGSAQARKKAGVLQHGSLPLEGDLTRICQVLVFTDDLARQAAAERLRGRATTVASALGRVVDWEAAAQAFVDGFESALGICLERSELIAPEIARTEELVREKYGHPAWTGRV